TDRCRRDGDGGHRAFNKIRRLAVSDVDVVSRGKNLRRSRKLGRRSIGSSGGESGRQRPYGGIANAPVKSAYAGGDVSSVIKGLRRVGYCGTLLHSGGGARASGKGDIASSAGKAGGRYRQAGDGQMNKHRNGIAGYALHRSGDCALDSSCANRHRRTNDGRGPRIPRSAAKLSVIGNRDSIVGAEGRRLVQHAVPG